MSFAPEDRWTEFDDKRLWRMWGYLPLSSIADHLDRSETACVVRAKRLKIPSIKDWPHVLAEWQLAPMLGLDRKTVWRHMTEGILPTMTLYKRNTPCMVVDVGELTHWLRRPENWLYAPPDKIQDPQLREIAMKARKEWGDRWLTTGEAARRLRVDHRKVNQWIHKGVLKGKKWGNWYLRRSDVEYVKRLRYGGAT